MLCGLRYTRTSTLAASLSRQRHWCASQSVGPLSLCHLDAGRIVCLRTRSNALPKRRLCNDAIKDLDEARNIVPVENVHRNDIHAQEDCSCTWSDTTILADSHGVVSPEPLRIFGDTWPGPRRCCVSVISRISPVAKSSALLHPVGPWVIFETLICSKHRHSSGRVTWVPIAPIKELMLVAEAEMPYSVSTSQRLVKVALK